MDAWKKNRRVKAKGRGEEEGKEGGRTEGKGEGGKQLYMDSLYNKQGPGLVVACNELELQSQSGT